MNELIRWHDGTLYVNGWLLIGLAFGLVAAVFLAIAITYELGRIR